MVRFLVLFLGMLFWVEAQDPAEKPANPPDTQILLTNVLAQWNDDRYESQGGVVIDQKKGLFWKSCSEGQEWSGNTCTGTAKNFRGDQISKQVEEINQGESSQNYGYDNWRIPTIKELGSLLAMDRMIPSINQKHFPQTEKQAYWSSSLYGKNKETLWVGYFGLGRIGPLVNYNQGYLRLVRSQD